MRSHYWTCSKFADWVRGTKKPSSATLEGWDEFEAETSAAHPFRYWLATTALDFIQDVVFYIPDKCFDIRCYCRNRFIQRVHLIDTKLTPGTWQDTDRRILHGVMEALVFYVEVDCAAWTKEKKTLREKGLEHLNWEITLTDEDYKEEGVETQPTDQAKRAMEVKELYLWWKDVRPDRLEPYDFVDEEADGLDRYKVCQRMEDEQEAEDTAMLIRVIKARHGMWT